MKTRNLLLSVAVLIGMVPSLTAQNAPSYLPANGLVGWWPFNGNANDESGNNLTNTSGGLQYSSDRFGNQGSSLRFLDDTNSFLTSSLPYTPDVTIGFWLMQPNPSTYFPVPFYFHNGNYENNEYSLFCNSSHASSNYVLSVVRLGTDVGPPPNNWFESFIPYSGNDSSWNHMAITIDNVNKVMSVYKNAVLSDTIPFQGQIVNFSQINFGHARKGSAEERYVGKLDDIALWNRALTPQEISQVYNQGICITSITVTDTLLIHTGISSYNPVAYGNTLKVWPNPGNTAITLDAGNLTLMQGWKISISNSLGQEVYPATLISQQQQVLSMSTWGGNGLYLLHLINPQGHITEVKKIVLAP